MKGPDAVIDRPGANLTGLGRIRAVNSVIVGNEDFNIGKGWNHSGGHAPFQRILGHSARSSLARPTVAVPEFPARSIRYRRLSPKSTVYPRGFSTTPP